MISMMWKAGFSINYIIVQMMLYVTILLWLCAIIDVIRSRLLQALWVLVLVVAPASAWLYWAAKVYMTATKRKISFV